MNKKIFAIPLVISLAFFAKPFSRVISNKFFDGEILPTFFISMISFAIIGLTMYYIGIWSGLIKKEESEK
jgi:hypothetical protein